MLLNLISRSTNMPKSEAEIERAIRSLKGTMAIEGLTLSDGALDDCRAIMRGEASVDDTVAAMLEKYRTTDKKDSNNREAG